MANNYFDIEGLHIEQELCAMKVGTDSVLLGRWAANRLQAKQSSHTDVAVETVLDIGCGTGILALLVAKLTAVERILAIDIDEGAYTQTLINISNNGMQGRIEARQISLQELAEIRMAEVLRYKGSMIPNNEESQISESGTYDYIVCNPPYFKNSLKCSDAQRNLARHNDSLSFRDLMQCSARLLPPSGCIAIIMPAEVKIEIDMEAAFAGLVTSAEEPVKTSEKKPVKRWIVEYSKIKNR